MQIPAIAGRVCYHPCRSGPSVTARCRFTAWSGSSRHVAGVVVCLAAGPQRQAGAGHRRRARRCCGLPPGPAPARHRPSRTPSWTWAVVRQAGLPDAARRPGRRAGPDRGARRARPPRSPGGGPWTPSGATAPSTRYSWRSARTCPSGLRHPGQGRGVRGRGVVPAQCRLGGAAGDQRRVAVYGGGNTAMDAARVARRMGPGSARPSASTGGPARRGLGHPEEADDAERRCGSTGCARRRPFRRPWREAMELDSGFPQPTGARDARRRYRDPGAGPGHRHRVPAPGAGRGDGATAQCRCRRR